AVAEVVQPALLAVALARRVDERQVLRPADAGIVAVVGCQEGFFERDRQVLGEADADEAAGRDGVAVAHQAHRGARADDLAAVFGAAELTQPVMRMGSTGALVHVLSPSSARTTGRWVSCRPPAQNTPTVRYRPSTRRLATKAVRLADEEVEVRVLVTLRFTVRTEVSGQSRLT